MAIIRWDPFREFSGFEDRWNRVFDEAWNRRAGALTGAAWAPPVDIYETDEHALVVAAELPGLRREDIHVTVENGTLTIQGERKFCPEVRKDQVHRRERLYGEFSRSFTLPAEVDTEHVSAEYRDGALLIKLPMREEAKPKQVPVTVAA